MFLPASVFVHNPDTTEEAYNHLHHWLWLDDVGWRHCKCHVRAKSKGDAEVRFSSFRITFYPFFLSPKNIDEGQGGFHLQCTRAPWLSFQIWVEWHQAKVWFLSSIIFYALMIVALQVGFPVAFLWSSRLSDLRFCFPPKVDVAQGTVKKRPKDSCQVVVDLSFNIPSKTQPRTRSLPFFWRVLWNMFLCLMRTC